MNENVNKGKGSWRFWVYLVVVVGFLGCAQLVAVPLFLQAASANSQYLSAAVGSLANTPATGNLANTGLAAVAAMEWPLRCVAFFISSVASVMAVTILMLIFSRTGRRQNPDRSLFDVS